MISFLPNGNAEYVKGSDVIRINGTNPESIFEIEGSPISNLSDIQNFFRSKGEELIIDESRLKDACLKRNADNNS